jgi:hypothetical protein
MNLGLGFEGEFETLNSMSSLSWAKKVFFQYVGVGFKNYRFCCTGLVLWAIN